MSRWSCMARVGVSRGVLRLIGTCNGDDAGCVNGMSDVGTHATGVRCNGA